MEKVTVTVENASKPHYGKNESRRILKNIVTVSLGFTLLFTAYSSTSSLQSSLNEKDGLGVYSQATVYATMIIGTLFVPTIVIRKLTTKWALCVSMLGYSFYIMAQYHPRFYTLLPAGAIVGIFGAPLWISKCSYLTLAATEYATLKGESVQTIVARFFGVFFCLFQTASIWGNLISSQVLSHGANSNSSTLDTNRCGVEYCPGDDHGSSDAKKPEESAIYTMVSVYLGCALAAVALTAIVLDPLSRYGEKANDESDCKLLFATFKHMANSYQILIIPLTIWSGIEQGFLGSDITSAFITCSWGVEKVGIVLICYGVCNAISSVTFGVVVKYTGRVAIFILGALINVSMIILMFNWKPNPEAPEIYFLLAGIWGMGDAIWQTQINAFYGVLFPKDTAPAFCNYRLWESSGFIIVYLMSTNVCIRLKLFIMLGFLFTGMLGYFAIEYLLRQTKKVSKIDQFREHIIVEKK